MSRLRLLTLTLSLALAAGALTAAPAVSVAGPVACPAAFPVARAVDGVVGVGYTVERGSSPTPFSAHLLGRITNGIAPGVDMIMADLSSAALARAGGVWQGMSGSPVYAKDGRLIGSVSYGLGSSSTIAGLTPAGAMKGLLNDVDGGGSFAARVAVPQVVALRLARTGQVSAAAATAAGFRVLPVPLSLSGAASASARPLVQRFSQRFPDARVMTSGSAARGTASAGSIRAGGTFAAALSYGDVTTAAIGTTTFVCGGKAVAFGHPFMEDGVVSMSLHPATALFVQPDPLFGPFTVANLGGVAGTVDRDRLVGLRGQLGVVPPSTLITSTITRSTGQSRTGVSRAVYAPFVPDIAAFHALYNIESVLGSAGKGSARMTLTITGTRADGRTFTVTRSDAYSSTGSLGYTVGDAVYFTLWRLVDQPFERVTITKVALTGTVDPNVHEYRVTSVKVRQGTVYVSPPTTGSVVARAGQALPVRITLTPYQGIGTTRTVDIAPVVPAGSAGSQGTLMVAGGGGSGESGESNDSVTTFTALLQQMRAAPLNAGLRVTLVLDTPRGTTSVTRSAVLDQSVSFFEREYPVAVR